MQSIQSELSNQTHLLLAFSAAIFADNQCDRSAHMIEAFLPGAVEERDGIVATRYKKCALVCPKNV